MYIHISILFQNLFQCNLPQKCFLCYTVGPCDLSYIQGCVCVCVLLSCVWLFAVCVCVAQLCLTLCGVCVCVCVLLSCVWLFAACVCVCVLLSCVWLFAVCVCVCCSVVSDSLRRVCVCVLLSCVWLFAAPWTIVHQAPLSMKFSRQEHWSVLPFPPPRDLPVPGIKPRCPAMQVAALPSEPPGKPSTACMLIGFPVHHFPECFPFGSHKFDFGICESVSLPNSSFVSFVLLSLNFTYKW